MDVLLLMKLLYIYPPLLC